MNPEATFFRSRPRVVQARRLDDPSRYGAIAQWCDGQLVELEDYKQFGDDGVMWVRDAEKNFFMAEAGDWIVSAPGGGFTVMRDDAFVSAFEAAVQL